LILTFMQANHPVAFGATPPWKGGEKDSFPSCQRRGACVAGGVVGA